MKVHHVKLPSVVLQTRGRGPKTNMNTIEREESLKNGEMRIHDMASYSELRNKDIGPVLPARKKPKYISVPLSKPQI